MSNISSIYGRIAPIHRAIWRGNIIPWLGIIFVYACDPKLQTLSNLFIFIVLFFILGILDIARGYPSQLYNFSRNTYEQTFGALAVIGTLLWSVSNWLIHGPMQWQWLLFALAATGIAYLLRPQPKN